MRRGWIRAPTDRERKTCGPWVGKLPGWNLAGQIAPGCIVRLRPRTCGKFKGLWRRVTAPYAGSQPDGANTGRPFLSLPLVGSRRAKLALSVARCERSEQRVGWGAASAKGLFAHCRALPPPGASRHPPHKGPQGGGIKMPLRRGVRETVRLE